jgi:hypothetical protein
MGRRTKPGKIIDLEFKYTDPKKDPAKLALELGSALTNEGLKKTDAQVFTEEAAKLEVKVQELQVLLDRIRARDRGEPVETTSRMDPMLTYNAVDVEKELKHAQETAAQFREDVKRYLDEAEGFRKESNRVQKLLAQCRQ